MPLVPDIAVVDRETNLQRDLIVLNLAALDVAAHVLDLEPAQVA